MMPTPWKKLMNRNYLGSWDLEQGKDLVLTIKHAYNQDVDNQSGGKDKCLLIDFMEDGFKPLILNNVNCQSIEKALGSKYVEDWEGKKISMFVASVSAFGEVVDAIRIRTVAPKEQIIYSCDECGKPIMPSSGMSSESIAQYTMKKYGKSLCADCAKKRKEAQK
jgi:hypothetical protein